MARVIRTRGQYDLKKAFSDRFKNSYSKNDKSPSLTHESLKLWLRMTKSSPSNLSNSSFSLNYDNSPDVENAYLGQYSYPFVNCTPDTDSAVTVSSTSSLLSFSTASSEGEPALTTDLPFSISLWYQFTALSLDSYFLTKAGTSGKSEYEVYVNAGTVIFYLRDEYSGGFRSAYGTIPTAFNVNNHMVLTYDGRGGNTASAGIQIYINGSSISLTTFDSGTYLGMQPFHGQPLYVGQSKDKDKQVSSNIAEVAIWGKQLTSSEVSAIYHGTQALVTFESKNSGMLSNPVRAVLQESDCHTGSYPTIARSGDPDFTGIYPSFYDDTNTINFVSSNKIVYPTILSQESRWVSGGIATPNTPSDIITIGAASKGVSDAHVSFTPGQSISPFSESRLPFDVVGTGSFITGTSQSIVPGFDQRLGSKASFVFDISPYTQTDIFFSTGSNVNNSTSRIGSGMAYFNWQLKKWEMIGDTRNGVRTGSNVDFLNYDPIVRSNSVHGFTGRVNRASSDPLKFSAINMGRPHSTHGFPFSAQYDPTGSQILSMTGTLTQPFLLEKVSINWSGTFASYAGGNVTKGPLVYNFFLLCISPVSQTVSIKQDLTGTVGNVRTSRMQNFQVNYVKDLVWTGDIARTVFTDDIYARDLTFVHDVGTMPEITGTFSLSSFPKIFGRSEGLATIESRFDWGPSLIPPTFDTDTLPLMANSVGFRNLAGFNEGKSYIRSVVGVVASGTFTLNNYTVDAIQDVSLVSPYVLQPNDKLVLGFSAVPDQTTYPFAYGSVGEEAISNHVTSICPGESKLVFHGSFLRNNEFVSPESNQPLTSDAIHESLHHNNPVFDQFDSLPFETFKGNYLDNIMIGESLGSRDDDVRATGSVTIVNAGTVIANASATPDEVAILSTDLTGITYIFKTGTTGNLDGSNVIVSTDGSPTAATLASRLKTAIDSANGHNGKILTSVNSTTVILRQLTGGPKGNYDISLTVTAGEITATGMSGGLSRNYRQVISSVTAGQAGTTGSLQRFLSLPFSDQTYYDSYPPNEATIFAASGKGLLLNGSDVVIAVGVRGSYYSQLAGADLKAVDTEWYFRPAYEVSQERFINSSLKSFSGQTFDLYNADQGVRQINLPETVLVFASGTELGFFAQAVDPEGRLFEWTNENSRREAKKFLFGFGDLTYNVPDVVKYYEFVGRLGAASIRGYKYGLAGIFGTPMTSQFRYDRFGQFRDMLQQAPNVAYVGKGTRGENTIEWPVTVEFYSRPNKKGEGRFVTSPNLTHSQNLDNYATSSLPYYDDVARERTDNPDVSLVDIGFGV